MSFSAELHIQMHPDELAHFEESLLKNPGLVFSMISDLDLGRAEAWGAAQVRSRPLSFF